jgi:transcription initiation factor TFIIIB Brf1 subunit/transcription initiation factor TFIIB
MIKSIICRLRHKKFHRDTDRGRAYVCVKCGCLRKGIL